MAFKINLGLCTPCSGDDATTAHWDRHELQHLVNVIRIDPGAIEILYRWGKMAIVNLRFGNTLDFTRCGEQDG
jgi:hypothetical protein